MKEYNPYEAQDLFPSGKWEKVVAATADSETELELNFGVDGMIGLRDGSDPGGPVWAFDTGEWSALEEAVKAGQTRK